MKYIHLARIGMGLYFDQLSELTAIQAPSPEECVDELQQNRFPVQREECRRIQGALRRLISQRYQLKGEIPARIQSVATNPFVPTPEQLLPVFQWVQALQAENQQAEVRCQYALQDVANHLPSETGSFLRAFSAVMTQRISLLPGDGTLTMALPESPWGQASLRFSGVPAELLPTQAVFGYLFWLECDRTENGYEFRFLLDTEFSETLYQERMLQPQHWQEISVFCADVALTCQLCDYTARIRRHGLAGMDALFAAFGELRRKEILLGASALTDGETRLSGMARLLATLDLLPDPLQTRSPEDPIDALLGNRYQLQGTLRQLREWDPKTGEALAVLLEKAQELNDTEEDTRCERQLNALRQYWTQMRTQGSGLQIAAAALADFQSATAGYTGIPSFAAQWADSAELIRAAVEPTLREHRFTGEFPHYVRLVGTRADYLSFTSDPMPVPYGDGTVHLTYSIAVASVRAEKKDGKITVGSRPYAQCSAAALEPIESVRAGRIFHPSQDGHTLSFPYRFTERPTDSALRDQVAQTALFGVKIGLRALDGRALPHGYRPHPLGSHWGAKAFGEMFLRYLPASAVFSVPTMVAVYLHTAGASRSIGALAAGLACGAAGVFLIASVRWLHIRRTVWHR